MSSKGEKRTVLLRYIRFKRGARCVLMRAEIGSRVQSRVQLFSISSYSSLLRRRSLGSSREEGRNIA